MTGLTGSTIVFYRELRRWQAPGHNVQVKPSGIPLPLDELWRRVHAARPGEPLRAVYMNEAPNTATNFHTVSARGDRVHTYIDQYTGRILYVEDYSVSPVQWIWELHARLLNDKPGERLNGISGMLLAATSLVGMFLWWPGRTRWRLGFRYTRGASWKRQVWDWHNLGGFLFCIPLVVFAITGAFDAYPFAYAAVVKAITFGPAIIPPPVMQSVTETASLDAVLRSASLAVPDSEPRVLSLPAAPGQSYFVRMRRRAYADNILGRDWVYLTGTGNVLRVDRYEEQPIGVRILRMMTPVHYGTFGGFYTRCVWILAGLMPGILFITGLVMWWNRSVSRGA